MKQLWCDPDDLALAKASPADSCELVTTWTAPLQAGWVPLVEMPKFETDAQLVEFLDSLYECDAEGTLLNSKWPSAQRAIGAIQNKSTLTLKIDAAALAASTKVLVSRVQAAVNRLQPPKHVSELRQEYWKAGARAAIRAISEALTPKEEKTNG